MRKSELAVLARTLNGILLNKYLDEDKCRLENNWFGCKSLAIGAGEVLLLVGARSGLEILYALSVSQDIQVIVVEHNSAIQKEIEASISKVDDLRFDRRVVFCSTFAEIYSIVGNKTIGIVRVDSAAFKWPDIEYLLKKNEVKHIAGEFDPCDIDPLAVFRSCRASTNSFFWRVVGRSTPLASVRSKYAYEVSVVVPAYKVRPWIDRCVESLAQQALNSIEIIVVDDGSPDDTGARADEWASMYPERVKVIHKANGGCATARNAGLAAAQGEFVAFVDADDWVDTRMFDELYRSVILNASDVAQCGYTGVFEDSGREEHYPTAWGGDGPLKLTGLVDDPHTYLIVPPTIWRRIYRKEFLDGNGIQFPEHIRRFDDLPFQFEVLSRVKRMSIIPDCFYFYRQGREGQDVAVRDHRLFVHFPMIEGLQEKVGVWMGAEIESYMIRCEMSSHMWALSRIEKRYLIHYQRLAAHQFIKNRVHHNPYEILKIGATHGFPGILFVLSCIFFSCLPKPEMISCN